MQVRARVNDEYRLSSEDIDRPIKNHKGLVVERHPDVTMGCQYANGEFERDANKAWYRDRYIIDWSEFIQIQDAQRKAGIPPLIYTGICECLDYTPAYRRRVNDTTKSAPPQSAAVQAIVLEGGYFSYHDLWPGHSFPNFDMKFKTRMEMGYGLHNEFKVQVDGKDADLTSWKSTDSAKFTGFRIMAVNPADPSIEAWVKTGESEA